MKFDKKLVITIVVMAAVVIVSVAFLAVNYFGDNSPSELTGSTKVLLETSMGDITIQLRTDKPITSENFRTLVEQGRYDNTVFHRIIEGFMIQGGIVSGTVDKISDEIGQNNNNDAYTVAMAKTSEPNSATSQFFINTVDNGEKVVDYDGTKFDQVYTVFGTVIEGKDVVDAISQVPCGPNPDNTSEISSPLEPVTLIKATMIP
ncbi:MAG: peptidylprolyl isomerase [Candidatus Bathyarchaeota archaeon]|nr:peptidylprolyl isomerase [Candidatus Bathyarchaeota archaeon]